MRDPLADWQKTGHHAIATRNDCHVPTNFVAAENSMGFHAPREVARVLAEAIDDARQGQLEVTTLGAK
jgi:formate-dependent nitrite reductase cytochrome c552 subunit